MVRSINLVTGKFQIKSLNRIPLNPKSYGIFQKIDAIYKKNLSIYPPHVIDSIKKSVNPICQKKKLQALKWWAIFIDLQEKHHEIKEVQRNSTSSGIFQPTVLL